MDCVLNHRSSGHVGYAFALATSLIPSTSMAGTISFDAKATLDGRPDQVRGTVELTLNATESIYDATLIATGTGERLKIGSVPLWEQHATKNFQIAVPSTHRWPGKYHLLIEAAFRDQGGGHLNAAMALDYTVQDTTIAGPNVTISGDVVTWALDTTPPENATLTAATPYFGEWAKLPWHHDVTPLPLQIRTDAKLRPNWIYLQTARLDWVENDVHGSRTVTWPLITDDRGHWRRTLDPQRPPKAQSKNLSVNAQSTLTATPVRLFGDITLSFADSETIYDVEVRVMAQSGAETLITGRPAWQPGEPLAVQFDVASPHVLPGNYYVLLPIRFRDQQQHFYDAVVAIGYRVNRAGDNVTAPAVVIGTNQLTWQLGAWAPENITLTLTSSPAWRSTPLHIPASANSFQLEREASTQVVPNWDYPQLARLGWIADGFHFSRVSSWTMHTDNNGDWSVRSGSTTKKDDDPSVADHPWWRRITFLWIAAGIAVVLALVQGYRQSRTRRTPSAMPSPDNQQNEPSPSPASHDS